MASRCYIIFTIFCLFSVVFSEEPGEKMPTYEYTQIFKSIPTLFEYLLDVLEQRPEILESDDVTAFSRNYDKDAHDDREKRATDKNNNNKDTQYNYEKANKIGLNKNADYMNENVDDKRIKNDGLASRNDITKDKSQAGQLNNINIYKSNTINDIEDDIMAASNEIPSSYFGFDIKFSLNYEPEDVIEQIIRIDEMLLEYNCNKDDD